MKNLLSKKFIIFLVILVALILQLHFNPRGYNFVIYPLLVLVILYFDTIKSLSFGILKIELLEKIINDLDDIVFEGNKTLIRLAMKQNIFSFAPEGALYQNANEIITIFDSMVKTIPDRLKIALLKDKETLNLLKKTIEQQRLCLIGTPEITNAKPPYPNPVSLEKIEIPDDVKKKIDFHDAQNAYGKLYSIYMQLTDNEYLSRYI